MSCIEDSLGKCLEQFITASNVKAVNEFQLLMAGGRRYPSYPLKRKSLIICRNLKLSVQIVLLMEVWALNFCIHKNDPTYCSAL